MIGLALLTAAVAALARVTGFVLFMLGAGIVGELFGWAIVAIMFGGDFSVFLSLSTLVLKFLIVSLASIAMFSSMDPDRFSNALLAVGFPDQLALALSYGYRMVPTLLEEYERIIHAYRLRGKELENPGFLHLRKAFYFAKLMIRAFYPLALNTALRVRTTMESLEIRGFTYAMEHPEVKELRLQDLRITSKDVVFLAATALLTTGVIVVGSHYPL